jgi:hypothetical protein
MKEEKAFRLEGFFLAQLLLAEYTATSGNALRIGAA